MNNKTNVSVLALALASAISLSACSGGDDGKDGVDGVTGGVGLPGSQGLPAGSFVDTVDDAADLVLTLAPTDIVVTGTEPFAVKFTASGKNAKGDMVPFVGLDKVAFYVTNLRENTAVTGAPMQWSNNALVNEFGSSMYCTPEGTATARGGSVVDACTLVEDAESPGTYTGTWEHDGNAPVVVADGDPNSMFRVMVRTYNVVDTSGVEISDKVLSAPVDFIPATGELAISAKDLVANATCIQCHSEIAGYGEGYQRIANIDAHHNYQQVENCIACHNPANAADSEYTELGFNIDFGPMVHTIHSGAYNAESGALTGEALEMFGNIGSPNDLADCTSCHQSDQGWNDNIYAQACVGCHMAVNFETGEGHSEFNLAQADDSQCMACHGAGDLSPAIAHKIGKRAAAIAALEVNVSDISYIEGAAIDDVDSISVILEVKFDGQAVAEGFDFTDYAMPSKHGGYLADIMVGTVDSVGFITEKFQMSLNGVKADIDGKVTLTKIGDLDLDGESLYLTSSILLCNDKAGELSACDGSEYQNRISVAMPTLYWNLAEADGSKANIGRLSQPDIMTASEDGCNTCHGNLTNHHYGNLTFTQCASCHNSKKSGSFFKNVYTQTGIDDSGEPVWETMPDVEFNNHDLVTVVHRAHSGIMTQPNGAVMYRDANNELVNYPAVQTDCSACHKEDAKLFADDGGLTSGKRAIAVDDNAFISPVAEACRSCHAHANPAAYAHFRSNGATTLEDMATTADLPIESCATCHAEGKTYGVDKVHGS
ncbi:decaheme c-type cytochrome, OmcA/MtrC family [Ferrimonas sediminum]|uniref:Decaheme c-type cytochrome, OmcA/MtrC family n=1 Tax=Ferrimonas sediminum TaxID=718193 RepID=A0A1G8T0M2_9GAMM|nr:OmcA/MtrC family decaheme c-type cytochrome [Ferrimonas sediminum]SDJ34565.1 decaheme c-type cytochrome, OmcA/MtrC family [Ferrimonas sediminum]